MAKEPPSLYSIPKTFVWFAIVSIALTIGLAAIVYTDYSREWKEWQKKFVKLKVEKVNEELRQAGARIDKEKLAGLKKQVEAANAAFGTHRADYQKIRKEIEILDSQIAKAGSRYQDLKQYQDSYRYFYEEYRSRQDPRAQGYDQKLKAIGPRADSAKREWEGLEKEKEEKEARAQSFVANEKAAQKEMDKILEEKNRIETHLRKIKPTLAKEILNAPMIDFMAPSLRIQQVVLEDLYDDYHFTKVQKVDRCTTCHLGIDQKGFEDAPQPFRTHPKLGLYLGANSPHPLEKVGCTTCHGGSGHSVSFKDAAHTPRSDAQAAEWRKKYHWQDSENWEPRMLPINFVQASCAKCHHDGVSVPQADQLNRGRYLAQTHGCFNCHKIGGSPSAGEEHWKVGPSLEHAQSKLSEDWIAKWLQDPRAFRPSTHMPRIFHLSNNASPEDREKDNAAIAGIAAYLMKNSEPVELSKPPVEGNAGRGERLVKELGCLGCHAAAGTRINTFGPDLSGLGSKVNAAWLYSWLKDPKHYAKDTRMPNLRLSDEAASDITSFLISQHNEKFETQAPPEAKPKVLDQMILEALQGTLRREEAQARLSQMTPEEKVLFIGKKSIAHQGCFSCHAIKGFEDTKPIGAELSNEGRKNIHQLDFGFTPIERSRHAWFAQKLKDSRIFDQGKVKPYYEKLRMPQFNFTESEIEALTTFILSLSEEAIPLQMQKRLSLKEQEIEKGRRLISKFNCNGCHTLDGKTGSLREFTPDPGNAPPVLDGEGAKVQEKWLHDFLKSPSTIRPWLTYRMPTFGLTEDELNDLVLYFTNLAHEEVSYQGHPAPETTPEKARAGRELFEKLQCAKCHPVSAESASLGTSFLAPDLALAKKRLKPDWVKKWLEDPQKLQPGTMMPTFFVEGQTPLPDILGGDAQEQIEAIRDYLYQYETPSKEETKKEVLNSTY